MAIDKIDFPTASTPSYTPDIEDDYNNQNEYIERNARGYNAISLTNWDGTTTKPQIAAGSVIEINGSTWDITTNTDIDTSGASSGTIYVYFDDATPEFIFLDTAPTWSATLNGWYTSGDRFTGHLMTWDGASSYTNKVMYELVGGAIANEPLLRSAVATTADLNPQVTTHIFPPGQVSLFEYVYAETGAGLADFTIEVLVASTWETIKSWSAITVPITAGTELMPFMSDGINFRAVLTATSNCTITLNYGYKPMVSIY